MITSMTYERQIRQWLGQAEARLDLGGRPPLRLIQLINVVRKELYGR